MSVTIIIPGGTITGVISDTASNNVDLSGSSGIFKTPTGALTIGPGTTTFSGTSTFTAAGTALTVNNNSTFTGTITAGTINASAVETITITSIAAANTPGLTLTNTTAATSGTQQSSPGLELIGDGYGTTAGVSQVSKFMLQNVPQSAAVVGSYLGFYYNENGAGYTLAGRIGGANSTIGAGSFCAEGSVFAGGSGGTGAFLGASLNPNTASTTLSIGTSSNTAAINIGTANATTITVGRSGQTLSMPGTVQIDGYTISPSPASSNQVLAYNGSAFVPTTLSGISGVTGTGVSGQVAFWNGTSNLTGATGFTWNGTTLTATNYAMPAASIFDTTGAGALNIATATATSYKIGGSNITAASSILCGSGTLTVDASAISIGTNAGITTGITSIGNISQDTWVNSHHLYLNTSNTQILYNLGSIQMAAATASAGIPSQATQQVQWVPTWWNGSSANTYNIGIQCNAAAGTGAMDFIFAGGDPLRTMELDDGGNISTYPLTKATVGTQTVSSGFINLHGWYWNGSAATDYKMSIRGVVDATTPTGHVGVSFQGTELFQLSAAKGFLVAAGGAIDTIAAGELDVGRTTANVVKIGQDAGGHILVNATSAVLNSVTSNSQVAVNDSTGTVLTYSSNQIFLDATNITFLPNGSGNEIHNGKIVNNARTAGNAYISNGNATNFSAQAAFKDSNGNAHFGVDAAGFASLGTYFDFREYWQGIGANAATTGNGAVLPNTNSIWFVTNTGNGTGATCGIEMDVAIPAVVTLRLDPGTTAGLQALIGTYSCIVNPAAITNLYIVTEWTALVGTSTTTVDVIMGFSCNRSFANPQGIGIYKRSTDTNWQLYDDNGTTRTLYDLGVAPTAGTQIFRMEYYGSTTMTGAKTVKVYINNTLVKTQAVTAFSTGNGWVLQFGQQSKGGSSPYLCIGPVRVMYNLVATPLVP